MLLEAATAAKRVEVARNAAKFRCPPIAIVYQRSPALSGVIRVKPRSFDHVHPPGGHGGSFWLADWIRRGSMAVVPRGCRGRAEQRETHQADPWRQVGKEGAGRSSLETHRLY